MKLSSKNKLKYNTKNIVLIAVMAATITGGKMALSFLPNIEIVTLLCALYGYVFGPLGLAAVFVFVICETLIWGFGTWIVSYLVYWPLVCCVFLLLGKFKVRNRAVLTLAAVVLTLLFGILTSLADVGLFMGLFDKFWYRFSVYYLRGVVYYIIQVICNTACFLFLFRPLCKVLMRYKKPRNILGRDNNLKKSDAIIVDEFKMCE